MSFLENWYVALAVLLGGYLGHISPIPAGGLVGGIVGGLLLKGGLGMGESKVALLSFVSQVLVAFVIVARSDLSSLKDLHRLVPVAVLYSLCLLGVSVGFSVLIGKLFSIDPITALFATPPGGLSGLGLAATEVGANAPVAMLFHLTRIILVMTLVPVIAKWWVGQ